MSPWTRLFVGLALAPVVMMLGGCPPIPTLWLFNAGRSEVAVAVVDGNDEPHHGTVKPGEGRRFHYDEHRPVRVQAGNCTYTYDLSSVPAKWGALYMSRLEPDFRLKVLGPSQDNPNPPHGDMPAFDSSAAVVLKPTRSCG